MPRTVVAAVQSRPLLSLSTDGFDGRAARDEGAIRTCGGVLVDVSGPPIKALLTPARRIFANRRRRRRRAHHGLA